MGLRKPFKIEVSTQKSLQTTCVVQMTILNERGQSGARVLGFDAALDSFKVLTGIQPRVHSGYVKCEKGRRL